MAFIEVTLKKGICKKRYLCDEYSSITALLPTFKKDLMSVWKDCNQT